MTKMHWKAAALLLLLAAVGGLAIGCWAQDGCVSGTALWEQVTGRTAEARVAAYVQAMVSGDERAAQAVWELPDWEANDGWGAALSARRQQVTETLMAAAATANYDILEVEWWRTCCEPGVIQRPQDAGGARFRVQLRGRDGSPLVYIYDVFAGDTVYWGAAAGYPRREWALRDVYPADQEPLFWRLVYEPQVRYLDWPPSAAVR